MLLACFVHLPRYADCTTGSGPTLNFVSGQFSALDESLLISQYVLGIVIEARVSHEELLFHPFACPSLFLKMIFSVINPFRIRGVLVFHTQECERLYLDQTMVIGCARVKFVRFYLTKYIVCLC